jgi:hypothetical protein
LRIELAEFFDIVIVGATAGRFVYRPTNSTARLSTRKSCVAGAELLRPGAVTKVELSPGGEQAITGRHSEAVKTVRTRWIVDASGVALGRKEG